MKDYLFQLLIILHFQCGVFGMKLSQHFAELFIVLFIAGLYCDAHFGNGKPDRLNSVRNSLSVQRSEEHTSELQSLMRISYAVFCLKKTIYITQQSTINTMRIIEDIKAKQ